MESDLVYVVVLLSLSLTRLSFFNIHVHMSLPAYLLQIIDKRHTKLKHINSFTYFVSPGKKFLKVLYDLLGLKKLTFQASVLPS